VNVPGRHVSAPFRLALSSIASACLIICPALQFSAEARQNANQDSRGRIRSEVSLVTPLVSVLDKNGRPALDLSADQFEVYEEGVKQIEAASRFIQKLVRPGDRLALYEFADEITQVSPFSSNVPTLQAALKRIVPGVGTALYDAVYLGAQALARNPLGHRRVIVLVTDGGGTISRADFDSARREALSADALLYTIVVRVVKKEIGRYTAGEHALETIADTTGGAMYYPDTLGDLGEMFDRIDRELRTQYRLGYYPNPRAPAGAYRSLEVRVKCDCKLRSRKGYYSGGHVD
jgi:hypothetical protein